MVALVPPNVLWNSAIDPTVLRILTMEVRKANTGDTIDVGTQMANPARAIFIGSTVNVKNVAAIAGTIITLPAGLTNDSGYMVVLGL